MNPLTADKSGALNSDVSGISASKQIPKKGTPNPNLKSVSKILHYKNWSFEIQGRIDQLIDTEDGHLIINEIKTIRNPLPEDSTRLRESYPHYIAQAAIYWELIQSLPDYADFRTSVQLTYVDIDTGLSQILSLEAEDENYLERQLDTLLPFLNDRSQARQRLNSICQAPFPTLREGQSELIQALETATLQSTHILVQAPTGFGKTGCTPSRPATHETRLLRTPHLLDIEIDRADSNPRTSPAWLGSAMCKCETAKNSVSIAHSTAAQETPNAIYFFSSENQNPWLWSREPLPRE